MIRAPISIGCSEFLKGRERDRSKIRSRRFSIFFRTMALLTVPATRSLAGRHCQFQPLDYCCEVSGRVAELADAQASGACIRKDVGVQVPPRPPKNPPCQGAAVSPF